MGAGKVAAGATIGSFFGPLGTLVGAGIGGLMSLNDEAPKNEIELQKQQVLFPTWQGHTLDWDEIGEVNVTEEDLEVFLTGGVCFSCLLSDFGQEEGWDGVYEKERVSFADTDFAEALKGAKKEDVEGLCDFIWSKISTSADACRLFMSEESGDLFINFGPAPSVFSNFVLSLDETEESEAWESAHLEEIENLAKFWRDRISDQIDHAEKKDQQQMTENWGGAIAMLATVLRLCQEIKNAQQGVTEFDGRDYTLALTTHQYSSMDPEEPDNRNFRIKLLEGFGDLSNAKSRKYIACSDGMRNFRACEQRCPPETMVVLAHDLALYNDAVEESQKLHFPVGHPVDGQIYVQHPHIPNYYYDLDTFHSTMLERKHSELMAVLHALGAKKVTLSVCNTEGSQQNRSSSTQVDVSAQTVRMGVETNVDTQGQSAEETNLYLHLAQTMEFNVMEAPHLPEGLLFYPYEDKWQQIAASALKSQCKRMEVTLEYRQDFAVTAKTATDVQAKLKALIPSLDVHVKTNFEQELKRMTSTTWHYTVEFATPDQIKRLGVAPASQSSAALAAPSASTASPSAEAEAYARAEQMLFKRAKRYATNDGTIDETERADLEALARKYGVDDLRLEEIIEEAFES